MKGKNVCALWCWSLELCLAESSGNEARVPDAAARGAGVVVQPARRAATARNRARMRMAGEHRAHGARPVLAR